MANYWTLWYGRFIRLDAHLVLLLHLDAAFQILLDDPVCLLAAVVVVHPGGRDITEGGKCFKY